MSQKKKVIPIVKPESVNHPKHYQTDGGIEVIDYIESLGIGYEFCVGNAIKYLSRAGKKDDKLQDVRKAQWYVNRAVQNLEKKRSLTIVVKS